LNARDHASLKALAQVKIQPLSGRQKALAGYISNAEEGLIHVSEKVKKFWLDKKAEMEGQLDVLLEAEKSDEELDAAGRTKREEYFEKAKAAWEVSLPAVLISLSKDIVGPYALGSWVPFAAEHCVRLKYKISQVTNFLLQTYTWRLG